MLASQSAINEFKLKKGFKQLFGKTVFSFLQEYRLNEAKKILTENEININEVCDIVGYKSVSHFSKIFKDYYGVNPIEIRKNQKRVYL
jgi:AraC-like DNA-binding protein